MSWVTPLVTIQEMPLAFAKMVKTVVPVRKAPAVLLTPPGGEAMTLIRLPFANVFCLDEVARMTESLDGSYVAEKPTGLSTVTRCFLTFLVDVEST